MAAARPYRLFFHAAFSAFSTRSSFLVVVAVKV
jgi:hypothetical protein